MIVIVYDDQCEITHRIARRIKDGIDRENVLSVLMSLNNIDEIVLDTCNTIIFGCQTSQILPGVSKAMVEFMDTTHDRYENQTWKNKLCAGFTTNVGFNSIKTLEDICSFSAKHSMHWISQGHIGQNEGHRAFFGSTTTRVNNVKSYLGCITNVEQNDMTPYFFGVRIAQQSRLFNIV
jgi:hypothetical protein